jgi:hypothetical protein
LKIPGSPSAGRCFLELSVFVVLTASLLFPSIQIGQDLKLPVEVFLLPVIYYLGFLLVCIGRIRPGGICFPQVAAALFSLSVLVSIGHAAVYLHHAPLIRDYYDVVKVWFPVLFFTIAYEADLSDRALQRLLTMLGFATVLVCLYGWAQFLDLPGLDKINPYYSGGEHHDVNLEAAKRVYSTLGNPNVLGQFLSCAFVCYVLKFLSNVGNPVISAVIALVVASTLVLTGSRYALILAACGLLLALVLTLSGTIRGAKLVGFVFLVGVLVWSVLAMQNTAKEAADRFQELSHPTEVASFRDRLDFLWIDAFEYFESSPIWGHGPAKAIFTDVWTDSEYLDVLKNYGIIGFGFYFAMHLWVLIQLWRGMRAYRFGVREISEPLGQALLFVWLGLVLILLGLAMNIGMTTYFGWKFSTFFWLILGLAVRAAHRIEQFHCRLPQGILGTAVSRGFSTRPRWV